MLIAITSCGASLNTTVGYSLRSGFSQIPGLGWMSPITPIGKLDQEDQNQSLYLEGQVGEQLPLVGGSLYQLVDESGSIWVKTSETLPTPGQELTIRAIILYEPILIADQDIGEYYATEQERLPQN
jgi:hypothetical protein